MIFICNVLVDYKADPSAVSRKAALVCGSRAHLEKEAIATRSIFRNILMHGFHFLVWFFTVSFCNQLESEDRFNFCNSKFK